MNILFLPRFGKQGASSRLRLMQYVPWLESENSKYIISPLFDNEMLLRKYQCGSYSFLALLIAYWQRIRILMRVSQFDLIWIEKESLPWFPVWFEKWLLRRKPYILDFDDAIFHNYDLHGSTWIRCMYGRRIDRLMSGACLVTAGNNYLADRAITSGARWVELIPTVVDLTRYSSKQIYSVAMKPCIVWIGSPSTVQYLLELSETLGALAKVQPFKLRVIGGGVINMQGVDIVSLPWSADTEAEMISMCDIGIMPLQDTPWELGKCAYKLIQYMACGLPTVASPVGANREVVVEGETGYFACAASQWAEQLTLLLRDATLRERMGKAGRERVEAQYCLKQTAPKLVRLLTKAGAK